VSLARGSLNVPERASTRLNIHNVDAWDEDGVPLEDVLALLEAHGLPAVINEKNFDRYIDVPAPGESERD
jgi:hypothetical protein